MQVQDTEARIRKQIAENPVILYMKGTPAAPECGFSRAAVGALSKAGKPFAYVNVLTAPHIREKLPKLFQWPTFPQLFVNGELIGGSDIILEMEADGSLKELLEKAVPQA
ncbi:glutaredoxin-related protein [Azotobacter vinelandii CA]|uniref:Glutaredoxin n=2 Tax=Azotobacter vinelandii TaxID=354 RepID=C1DMB6_AZOVD|nr:Grx4 family monothiol glutaredoxin [Azotobacter vinelandii]ACO81193.1 glutaredoxin-related protein [Azotobacter vinelandii DJ]AGK14142.1 glutaredoxin-related protein [Azotobacter vinelandii CA]AGK22395.1 glutaredoxin-related protein [Azotobacter vinelandii CA6]SFX65356.1 monothiol glutaredoxin [Azotobacter vinelandii]GLK57867.1 glutaredoxin [Azotobacter vinelandii]